MSHLSHCDLFPLSGFIEYVVVLPENLGYFTFCVVYMK